jgi:hypothetical protein
VTLIEAASLGSTGNGDGLTDAGYTHEQLTAIRERVFDAGAYLDVVDQLRSGRALLYESLLEHADQWTVTVRPFDVVANVHDLQVPFKYRYCSHRNRYQMWMECCAVAFADGRWFTADSDRRLFGRWAATVLRPEVVARADADALSVGSPIALDEFDETYAETPSTFHAAGSLWEKKRTDRLLAIGERLHDRFGIETLLTSMEATPDAVRSPEWVTASPNADRATYERALAEGDIAVCASDYETMPRTPFEQAASGQVLLLRDEQWVEECSRGPPPRGRPRPSRRPRGERRRALAGGRRRNPPARRPPAARAAAVGRRTYADLRARVERKRHAYDGASPPEREIVDQVVSGESADAIAERTAAHTDDGRPLPDDQDSAYIDLVYALRSLGYADTGEPGTPVFRPVTAESRASGEEAR